jgi:hypothetical protein
MEYGTEQTYTSGGVAKSADKNQWSNNTSTITTSTDHLF